MTGRFETALRSASAALIATLVTVGCSDGAEPGQSGPEVEAAAVSSLGAEIYARNCASCHGTDLRGTDRGPSQLSVVYEPNHHPDEAYRSAIANGSPQHHWPFGDMPPIAGLSNEEVEAVIAFIRSEQERHGFEH